MADEETKETLTRRDMARLLAAAPVVLGVSGCATSGVKDPCETAAALPAAGAPQPADHTVVVIGSGFGATMTALSLAHAMADRKKNETILMLERGTWWTTPVATVADKDVRAADFLRRQKQPVQYWSSVEHFKGLIDLFLRCVRRKKNEDGLYDLTKFGRGTKEEDGVTVLRASGVGGGSLIYANVTIQPPDLIFDDPRWPGGWKNSALRNDHYDFARDAIGYGVIFARKKRRHATDPTAPPGEKKDWINTGLSNIATRNAGINPRWKVDPKNPRVRRIDDGRGSDVNPQDPKNALWLPRARVFQQAMSGLTSDFGLVDSSINDIDPQATPFEPGERPANYCERQGRCIIGCLPGARHTLNKQLMTAILGKPDPKTPGADLPPDYPFMSIQTLAEVCFVKARPQGGYEVHYSQRDQAKPWLTTPKIVTADRVIIAAGCVGTNEIVLRSKGTGLPNLSDKVGFGFSTNGDYLAFLENIKDRVSLTKGPVTTSFAHFHTADPATGGDPSTFHTIEDNGIPRALSSVTGFGVPLLRALATHGGPNFATLLKLVGAIFDKLAADVKAYFTDYRERQEEFRSEDEITERMMCIAAMGREAAVGQFRLGTADDETPLRVKRADGLRFLEDPIYKHVEKSLDDFAKALMPAGAKASFENPFIGSVASALGGQSIGISHPLGGCRMAGSASDGVCDEFGRVFDKSKTGTRPFYEGLYVADAAVIPTSLGVNPSLTISAIALRTAGKVIDELP